MSKQLVAQKFIFKIHTDRLRKAKWKLTLTLAEARQNEEIISIGDSQMLRWIDEINGVVDSEERVNEIRRKIKELMKRESVLYFRRQIRSLYNELDSIQFKPDYMHLVVDKNKDFLRACKGFTINDVRYVRLLGTSGGVKNSTVVFVNEKLALELRRRIDNGRNADIPFVPAKLEAYRALTCSGSTPVSMPNGILVVPDCVTHFKEDVLYLSDENDGEPEMRLWKDFDVELTESDGYGLMLPSLAQRWSKELKLGYVASAFNTRQSWEKGCVFAFDFVDFADKVAGTRMVKDAWGNEIDIGNVELILTTSMLKLWSCYDSIEHYLGCCKENKYTFGVAKTSPEKLEDSRSLNYQFIQSYDLTDEQIDELIRPTIDEIYAVLAGDYRRALIFLAGSNLDNNSAMMQDGFVKAMMINPEMFNDPYVKHKIKHAISKRIDDAKIGVLDVHGNYSILCGDPYALCQSIFGLQVTGLLSRGEIFNKYWVDSGATDVACFRAPMSCANNILKRRIACSDEAMYWYRYISTCTLFNAWDDGCAALNGADKDGDIVFLTDNPVLVENIKPTLTLVCAQKSATKKIVTEADLVQSNIDGFGNEVGKVTNWVTSMYDVQAQFEPGSEEYEALSYRIQCGQLYQQNTIDKTKGIVSKPMPKYWHDYRFIEVPTDDTALSEHIYMLNRAIVADKKPYFMRYVYPVLMKEYRTYIRQTEAKALIEFGMSISEIERVDVDARTERQNEFLKYYYKMMPVGIHDCTMNRICRRIETVMDEIKVKMLDSDFDYSIMKSGCEYKLSQYYAVKKLFTEYNSKTRELAIRHQSRTMSDDSYADCLAGLTSAFEREAEAQCNNESQLCDIVLDLCYSREGTKQFAWDIAERQILHNMLLKSGGRICFPVQDENGDFEYCGKKFSMAELEVDIDGDSVE